MKLKFRQTVALGVTSMMVTAFSASAANTFYAPGDLVLYFQQEGGGNTVYANLGNAATDFRGSVAGPGVTSSLLNIVNLNSTLISAFGPGWANATNLYVGLAGVWNNSALNATLQDGDPSRTVYISDQRAALGDIYTLNSTGYTVANTTSLTTAASAIINMNAPFENLYNAQTTISVVGDSTIDNNNPFLAVGIQGTAFGTFAGGVQQVGVNGDMGNLTIGANDLGNIEFALDVHRIVARNNIAGQVAGTPLQSSFEGSVVIGTDGNVSFLAIPEPSSVTLAGLAGLALAFRRRRNA